MEEVLATSRRVHLPPASGLPAPPLPGMPAAARRHLRSRPATAPAGRLQPASRAMPGLAARRPGQVLRAGVRASPRQHRRPRPGPGSQHPTAGVPDAPDRPARPGLPRRTSSSAFHRPPGGHRADPRVLAALRRPRPSRPRRRRTAIPGPQANWSARAARTGRPPLPALGSRRLRSPAARRRHRPDHPEPARSSRPAHRRAGNRRLPRAQITLGAGLRPRQPRML